MRDRDTTESETPLGLEPTTTVHPAEYSETGTTNDVAHAFRCDPDLMKRETKIIGRESEYLMWRKWAIGVAAGSLLLLVIQIAVRRFLGNNNATGFSPLIYIMIIEMFGVILGGVTAYAAHARYQHAKCARLYREYLQRQVGDDTSASTASQPAR